MIIYNTEWLDNLETRKLAQRWLKKKYITAEEEAEIMKVHPTGYRESNWFARIGMFLFSLVLIASAEGLISLVIIVDSYKYFWVHSLFFGIAFYIAAEFLIRENHYFRSGVTDGLIYSSVFCLLLAMTLIIGGVEFNFDADPVYYYLCALPVLLYTALRFADAFLMLLTIACIVVLNALLIFKIGAIGKQLLPFETMLLAVALYLFVKKEKKKSGNRFYRKNLFIAELLALVIFYLSGNYYVVRELGASLNHVILAPGQEIPLAFFFYAFTIVVPLFYLWRGLKQKDYILIRLGLILETAGILTIRYYHSILPTEVALILGGVFLVVVAWLSIRYLRSPKHGLTYLPDDDANEDNMTVAASLILSEVAGRKHAATDDPAFGGGGSFGGGGAEGKF